MREKNLVCRICQKRFKNRQTAMQHAKTQHCDLTDRYKSFKRDRKLTRHQAESYKTTVLYSYFCRTCAKVYQTEKELKFHRKSQHQEAPEQVIDLSNGQSAALVSEFVTGTEVDLADVYVRYYNSENSACKVCGPYSDFFNHKNRFLAHMKAKHGLCTFDKECNKVFLNAEKLRAHLRKDHGLTGFPAVCSLPDCTAIRTTKQSYLTHLHSDHPELNPQQRKEVKIAYEQELKASKPQERTGPEMARAAQLQCKKLFGNQKEFYRKGKFWFPPSDPSRPNLRLLTKQYGSEKFAKLIADNWNFVRTSYITKGEVKQLTFRLSHPFSEEQALFLFEQIRNFTCEFGQQHKIVILPHVVIGKRTLIADESGGNDAIAYEVDKKGKTIQLRRSNRIASKSRHDETKSENHIPNDLIFRYGSIGNQSLNACIREKYGNFAADRVHCKSAEAITVSCRKEFDEQIIKPMKEYGIFNMLREVSKPDSSYELYMVPAITVELYKMAKHPCTGCESFHMPADLRHSGAIRNFDKPNELNTNWCSIFCITDFLNKDLRDQDPNTFFDKVKENVRKWLQFKEIPCNTEEDLYAFDGILIPEDLENLETVFGIGINVYTRVVEGTNDVNSNFENSLNEDEVETENPHEVNYRDHEEFSDDYDDVSMQLDGTEQTLDSDVESESEKLQTLPRKSTDDMVQLASSDSDFNAEPRGAFSHKRKHRRPRLIISDSDSDHDDLPGTSAAPRKKRIRVHQTARSFLDDQAEQSGSASDDEVEESDDSELESSFINNDESEAGSFSSEAEEMDNVSSSSESDFSVQSDSQSVENEIENMESEAVKYYLRCIYQSPEDTELKLNLLLVDDRHVCRILKLDRLANSYRCPFCGDYYRNSSNFKRHCKGCEKRQFHSYAGGVYQWPKTLLEKLKDAGINLDKVKQEYGNIFYEPIAAYDCEVLLEELKLDFSKATMGVDYDWNLDHIPNPEDDTRLPNDEEKQQLPPILHGENWIKVSQKYSADKYMRFRKQQSKSSWNMNEFDLKRCALTALNRQHCPSNVTITLHLVSVDGEDYLEKDMPFGPFTITTKIDGKAIVEQVDPARVDAVIANVNETTGKLWDLEAISFFFDQDCLQVVAEHKLVSIGIAAADIPGFEEPRAFICNDKNPQNTIDKAKEYLNELQVKAAETMRNKFADVFHQMETKIQKRNILKEALDVKRKLRNSHKTRVKNLEKNESQDSAIIISEQRSKIGLISNEISELQAELHDYDIFSHLHERLVRFTDQLPVLGWNSGC